MKSLLSDDDIYLFNEGTHQQLYRCLGAHPTADGTTFAVWAPSAEAVSLTGDFNYWDPTQTPMTPRASSGIWEVFVPLLRPGEIYKYHIRSRHERYEVQKADPIGFFQEGPPKTASIVCDLDTYRWGDNAWMASRGERNAHGAPISIYEVHLGSWMRVPEEGCRSLTYLELAPKLCAYVSEMGFTHVEFMPVMEHPFYGSWGYQVTGFFAPTSRYGTPQEFMHLVDALHQAGVGVILDWVPAHFPNDEHGLALFDGTHLYEHADARKGFHPDWKSCIFNYGRNEVRSFLVSSALFWLDRYHADGLRVDGVASMLYLDYSREEGEWLPNEHGGRENLEAVSLLKELNAVCYARFPDIQTIAEESTAWGMVSRPVDCGGLGFGFKWDMGWMHDTLKYMAEDSVHRRYHQNEITFRMVYAFKENFVLPLSHDEVVHGKGSLLDKMPGDDWQKLANFRLLLGYMFGQPGKKLLFMGAEIGCWKEWIHEEGIEWHLAQFDRHQGVQSLVKDLNRLYRREPALHQLDVEPNGFEWVDFSDEHQSVLSFLRLSRDRERQVLVACNFTPVPRYDYRIGVPCGGRWRELLNSDATVYGGSGMGNCGAVDADESGCHGRPFSVSLTLPPLGVLFLSPNA